MMQEYEEGKSNFCETETSDKSTLKEGLSNQQIFVDVQQMLVISGETDVNKTP